MLNFINIFEKFIIYTLSFPVSTNVFDMTYIRTTYPITHQNDTYLALRGSLHFLLQLVCLADIFLEKCKKTKMSACRVQKGNIKSKFFLNNCYKYIILGKIKQQKLSANMFFEGLYSQYLTKNSFHLRKIYFRYIYSKFHVNPTNIVEITYIYL